MGQGLHALAAGLALSVLALPSPPALALQPAPLVTPAGQVELARLVDLASQRLSLNIEYDATVLRGSATLRLDAGLSDDELWTLTGRVLASRGFTTVRAPGEAAYSVVRLADAPNLAAAIAPATIAELSGGEAGETSEAIDLRALLSPDGGPLPGYASVLIETRHRTARDLAEQLTRVLSRPAGTATAVGDGMVLVGDLTHRLGGVLSIASRLDRPAAEILVEEVVLTSLTGAQMATLAGQVAARLEQATGRKPAGEVLAGPDARSVLVVASPGDAPALRAMVESLDRRERAETVTYSPLHFPARDVAALLEQAVRPTADERWRLSLDELTGSIVLTATPAAHEAARALVKRLDDTPAASRRPVRTFVLKNRSVTEVRGILEQLLAAGVLEASAEAGGPEGDRERDPVSPEAIQLPPPAASGRSGGERSAGDRAAADRRVGTGGAGGVGGASRPVARTPSGERPLVLTADEGTNTLIAVGEPRLLAQVESLLRTLDVRQSQVMLEVLMVTLTEGQSLDLGVEIEKLTTAGDAQIRLSSLFGLGARTDGGDLTGPEDGAGFTGVVLSPGDFAVVLRALETMNHGRSQSMPRLLVGNNQQATLDSVVQQPFASVNASTTIATTSFGGTQDAGTVVTIRPQIAEGDHLVLEYTVSLSSFLGAAASQSLPPPRQQNSVQSVATIPDGHTVVVGGIELEDRSQSVSQVPILGGIPLLGEVFKSRSNSSSGSRFYVFIRANVLRDRGFEDLRYLSGHAAQEAGVDDGWPEVQARIVR